MSYLSSTVSWPRKIVEFHLFVTFSVNKPGLLIRDVVDASLGIILGAINMVRYKLYSSQYATVVFEPRGKNEGNSQNYQQAQAISVNPTHLHPT